MMANSPETVLAYDGQETSCIFKHSFEHFCTLYIIGQKVSNCHINLSVILLGFDVLFMTTNGSELCQNIIFYCIFLIIFDKCLSKAMMKYIRAFDFFSTEMF